MTINSEGVLNYFHFDKPGEAKGAIDLRSAHVSMVRFTYTGAKQQTASSAASSSTKLRPTPDLDDEFRIIMANQE